MSHPGARELELFDALAWRLARRQAGSREGAQRGRLRGSGETFADVAPFLQHPDPRRLDLRRSFSDPFRGYFVRRFERRADLDLHLLLDASASLGAAAAADRQGLAALLAAGLCQAARRGRDRAALQVLGGEQELLHLAASRRAGLALEVRQRIAALAPTGAGVGGLLRAAAALPTRRLLVVLVSDFDWSPAELDAVLSALQPRPTLPLWLRDSGLEAPPGARGIAALRDAESGRRRLVLTSPRWARRQREAAAERRRQLRRVFWRHGRPAIEVRDSIDVGDLIAAIGELRP